MRTTFIFVTGLLVGWRSQRESLKAIGCLV